MTTIITRVFPEVSMAETALKRLDFRGFPKGDRHIVVAGPKAEAEMTKLNVHESAIAPYLKHLNAGRAVLVVKATYKPLGAVRICKEILAKFDTVDPSGSVVEEHSLPWAPEKATSILKDHPLFLTIPGLEVPGRITEEFGMPLLKAHKTKRPLLSADNRMSRKFWPMALVSKKQRSSSVIRGGRQMSRLFWPAPLISRKPRRKSVIPGGSFPLSRRLGLRLLS